MLTSRERVLCALDHQEPDRVPVFFGSSGATTMLAAAYDCLKAHLDIQSETQVFWRAFQSALLDEEVMVRFPGNHYYEIVEPPLRNATADDIERYPWSNLAHPSCFEGLAAKARAIRDAGYAVVALSGVNPSDTFKTEEMVMAKIYFDDAGDLSLLESRVVSVLGYGNQGSAQAQNMRDSGVKVVIGNPLDTYFEKAVADGFEVYDIAEAVRRADYHLLLVPDEIMPQMFDKDVRPYLKPGQAIVVSSGYNITYGFLRYPTDVDVLMVAPRTIGAGVRKTFLNGTGFPSLVAVHHDASGHAREVMLALSKAIGSLKRCAIESSCDEETLCDLFNEHSGGLYALRRAYELLVEAGVSAEAAMLEFWVSGEGADVTEVIQSHGLFGQIKFHSQTSQYGQQVTGRLSPQEEEAERERLRRLIGNIKDGTFAKEWTLEQQAGYPVLNRVYRQNMSHPMVAKEQRLLHALGLWKGDADE